MKQRVHTTRSPVLSAVSVVLFARNTALPQRIRQHKASDDDATC